jgi:hypothetical protein
LSAVLLLQRTNKPAFIKLAQAFCVEQPSHELQPLMAMTRVGLPSIALWINL